MRLIDADALTEIIHGMYAEGDDPSTYHVDAEGDTLIGKFAVVDAIFNIPTIQPEIIRCKDCKYWVHGYITDNDDFIPPKCGEWQQMVGHSSDDYCSLAERREVTT